MGVWLFGPERRGVRGTAHVSVTGGQGRFGAVSEGLSHGRTTIRGIASANAKHPLARQAEDLR
jgi:hypothetical protein